MEVANQVVVLITTILSKMMMDYASARTAKYFISDPTKFEARVKEVARTLVAVISRRSPNAMIKVGEDHYAAKEYFVPERMNELAKAMHVYLSKTSIERQAPIYELPMPEGELLSPTRVKLFFEGYSKDQLDDTKIKIVEVEHIGESVILADFQYLFIPQEEGTGLLLEWNEGGRIGAEVAQLLKVSLPTDVDIPDEFCSYVDPFSMEVLGKWLLQIK